MGNNCFWASWLSYRACISLDDCSICHFYCKSLWAKFLSPTLVSHLVTSLLHWQVFIQNSERTATSSEPLLHMPDYHWFWYLIQNFNQKIKFFLQPWIACVTYWHLMPSGTKSLKSINEACKNQISILH